MHVNGVGGKPENMNIFSIENNIYALLIDSGKTPSARDNAMHVNRVCGNPENDSRDVIFNRKGVHIF
jgi:hypothetical protein